MRTLQPSAAPRCQRRTVPPAAQVRREGAVALGLHWFPSQEQLPELGGNGGAGDNAAPRKEARRAQDRCSSGRSVRGTAAHHPVPGWTRSQRCTQVHQHPPAPSLRSSQPSSSASKNHAETESREKIQRADSGIGSVPSASGVPQQGRDPGPRYTRQG